MKSLGVGSIVAALVCFGMACRAWGQDHGQKPAYLDTNLPAEKRAADLVKQMTLEEKASQLLNQARAIPRLNVPAYDWWSEALHGVAVNGTTEFPEPVGLAATFDPAAIHQMAIDISVEGRIKHAQDVRAGHSNIFEGLDFWAPNINIFRDPRWGRGQETYGEDPFLTARMGVAFVTGMQGDDPRYYRVISTPKHYAVHSGPESTRHSADVTVSKHDEIDTYLPAFRATVTEAGAASVMCAYNSINGQPACANEFLLQDQLRGKWGFKGYVVSDCGAVTDIFSGHKFTKSQPEASAISLKRGMDNECGDFFAKVKDDHDYRPYIDAVKQGYLKESEIDVALIRLFTARIKLGMFDPPEMVPYSKIDESELNSAEHRALARKLANESMVLLKNDGVLPLKTSGSKITLVGPLADQTKVLLGNYNGTPSHTVSILEGMKNEFPNATINYVEGTQFLSKKGSPVPASVLTTDGKPGIKASYSQMSAADLFQQGNKPPVIVSRVEPGIDAASQTPPSEMEGKGPALIHWEGTLTAPEAGDYNLGMVANGFFRLSLDGKEVTTGFQFAGADAKLGRVHLEQGKSYLLAVDYGQMQNPSAVAKLVWSKIDLSPQPEAIAAAKEADVVVAVVGITSELEGEEMQVHEEGFKGGDRTSINLPKPEEDLLQALGATGKPLVVVLTNGSALAVNWAKDHANAILEAWYPGEEGGAAVAETLSGRNNPAGRLPVTFYKDLSQLPAFEDYSMKGRTYRYFEGTPLYSFGYGLSYTTFSYGGLNMPGKLAGDAVVVEATVTNTGKTAGDEVAQLYLTFPNEPGAPQRALRAFQRVHLDAGASQKVRFELKPRDLSMVSVAGDPMIAKGDYTISVGSGQPNATPQVVTAKFHVNETKTLPE
jgi:beta-glucosidase